MQRWHLDVALNDHFDATLVRQRVALLQKTIIHTHDIPIELSAKPAYFSIICCEPFDCFHDAGSFPRSPVCKITGTIANRFGDLLGSFAVFISEDALYRGRQLS